MSFSDILKKSFLEGYSATTISATDVITCLLVTFAIGVYIFFIYKLVTKRAFYDQSFNMSLPLMAIITAGIIITIQNSVVVSLGMVGALSIVRFRTAVKNPIDLVFLFWAISCGIICGAGLAMIAVILSLVITVSIIILNVIPNTNNCELIVVNSDSIDSAEAIITVIKKFSKKCNIKTQAISENSLNMVIEIFTEDNINLLKEVKSVEGVTETSIVSHDGDVTF